MTEPLRIQLSRRAGARLPPDTIKVDRSTRWGNPYRVWCDTDAPPIAQWMVSQGSCHWGPYATAGTAAAAAIELYRADLTVPGPHNTRRLDPVPTRADIVKALRGRHLACWCKLCPAHAAGKPFGEDCRACAPCHADTLGFIANGPICEAAS